jgi:hypothetical protein
MSASLRTDSATVEVIDNHRIGITVEGVAGSWGLEHVSIRDALSLDSDEVGDVIVEIKRPMGDGERADRPDQEWCFICQEWFKKGEHKSND